MELKYAKGELEDIKKPAEEPDVGPVQPDIEHRNA
jgi:hypothetical protein